jgi:hypothetical protein
MADAQKEKPGFNFWFRAALATGVGYIASSGPLLATAFLLREMTHWDGFYAAIYLYYPLLIAGRENPFGRAVHAYIEWWVRLFGTVGPG